MHLPQLPTPSGILPTKTNYTNSINWSFLSYAQTHQSIYNNEPSVYLNVNDSCTYYTKIVSLVNLMITLWSLLPFRMRVYRINPLCSFVSHFLDFFTPECSMYGHISLYPRTFRTTSLWVSMRFYPRSCCLQPIIKFLLLKHL